MAAGDSYLLIRPARREESRRIAEFYRISSDGVADYIWSKLAEPGETPLDVGERRYARQGTPFSYENCTLAEIGGRVVGMLVAFPMHVEPQRPEDQDEKADPVLAPFMALEEDESYYICGLAVEEGWRRRGIAHELMREAEIACRRLGFSKLSLIVFERNTVAKAFYERLGFRERTRRPITPHRLIHYEGDALLMVKTLPEM